MWPKVGDQKISDSDWKEFLNENKTIILYKMKAAKFRKERWLKVAPMCTWRGSSYALSIEFTQYNIVVHKYNNRGPQSLNCALLFDGVGIHWNTITLLATNKEKLNEEDRRWPLSQSMDRALGELVWMMKDFLLNRLVSSEAA